MKFSDNDITISILERRQPRNYPFPGAEGAQVAVRLLTDGDLDTARLAAVQFCKGKMADLVMDPEFLERAIQRQILFQAFRDADKPDERFFETYEQVTHMDNLMVRTLYELYQAHQQAMDPLAFCPAEEVEALIANLGKSAGSAARLSLFDRPTLLSFALSMASMLRETRQTPKSNTGSPVAPSGSASFDPMSVYLGTGEVTP